MESVSGNTITTIEGNTFKGGVSQVGRNTYTWNAQKDGTISHGGKTYTEWLKLQEKDEQPIGGDEPKLVDNEVLLDGKVDVIKEK